MDEQQIREAEERMIEVVREWFSDPEWSTFATATEMREVMLIAEFYSEDPESDEEATTVSLFCTDERGWIQRGLLHEALETANQRSRPSWTEDGS
jgi:hypothetical protein